MPAPAARMRDALAGWIPAEDAERVARSVYALGVRERSALASRLGPLTWRAVERRMFSVDAAEDLAWALGYGLALTDHLVAPVGLDPEDARAVVELGALANLIVMLHDNLIEGGVRPGILLSASTIVRSQSAKGRRSLRTWARFAPPVMRAMTLLVVDYQERLEAIAAPGTLARTRASIMRMYEAQMRVVRDGVGAPTEDARAKSALPFVVMALPAWGTRSSPSAGMDSHLAFVASVGDLVGRIDDLVDEEEDARDGAPNSFAQAQARGQADAWLTQTSELARDVASSWRAPRGGVLEPHVTGLALAACVDAWLALADPDQ